MMMKIAFGELFLIICISLQTSHCSYLGHPRIHFSGRFRADVNFANNDRCYFCANDATADDASRSTSQQPQGNDYFEFLNTVVTSVVYDNGTRSVSDKLIGESIICNVDGTTAKIADLDVECQQHSTVYGMKFGIKWYEPNSDGGINIAFHGDWTRNIIVQYMWRGTCIDYDSGYTSQAMTTVTGIDWSNLGNSEILGQLHEAVGGGDLVVKITLNFFESSNAQGTVVGFIGVPSTSDTFNIPGSRELLATKNSPVGIKNDCLDDIDSSGPAMYTAPLEVNAEMEEIRIDLSNSIPREKNQELINIGDLQLGFLNKNDNDCVQLLGDVIDYPNPNGGIYTIPVGSYLSDVQSSPIVVVQVIEIDENAKSNICSEKLFSTSTGTMHTAVILLHELTPFVRPHGYYVARLDSVETPSTSMTFYVTEYGFPAKNAIVNLKKANLFGSVNRGPEQDILPENGVVPTRWSDITDDKGLVTFEFKIGTPIPLDREYQKPDCQSTGCPMAPCPPPFCTLPIDGQVYFFEFCAQHSVEDDCQNPLLTAAFLAFSEYSYTSPPNWVDHVEPIFSMYIKIAPYMRKVMDLSDYDVVTKSYNIESLKRVFALDLNDPSYMPTMRDLSPIKQRMIVKWLDNPCHDKDDCSKQK